MTDSQYCCSCFQDEVIVSPLVTPTAPSNSGGLLTMAISLVVLGYIAMRG